MRPNLEHGDIRVPESFWSKTAIDLSTGCWVWNAAKSAGYGKYWDQPNQKLLQAHRFSYETLVGPIPQDLVLDHRVCSRPACVNPAHLVPMTINQNGNRERSNRCRSLRHELAGDNVLLRRSKRWGEIRLCRTCRNEKRRQDRALFGRADYDKEPRYQSASRRGAVA